MRCIFHVDMNSFFASVEQQKNPLLRGKPVVVGGAPGTRSIVAAASREAKKFGIKTAMPTHEALRLCPSAIFVPPDFEAYVDVHRKMVDIFQRFTDAVEVFSIDEAFLEVSGSFAHADTVIPSERSESRDPSRKREEFVNTFSILVSSKGVPRLPRSTRSLGMTSGENEINALTIAHQIKSIFRAELGEILTCSIGIAANKTMAKLGSDLKKPDGLTVILPGKETEFLDRAQLQDICGIGPRVDKRLRGLGITSFSQMRAYPEAGLIAAFGPHLGHWLHEISFGRDDAPVVPLYDLPEQKSFSKQHTLAKNTRDPRVVAAVLMKLSEIVGRKMRAEDKSARQVFWWLRFGDFSGTGGHRRMPQPLSDSTDIFRAAWTDMYRKEWPRPIRLVSVGVADLVRAPLQLNLFSDKARQQRLTAAMDKVNDIYGEFTVRRGNIFDPDAILEASTNAMARRTAAVAVGKQVSRAVDK